MSYLLLSVLFSSSLFVILKYFKKFQIDNLQAIVINYFVAFSVGYLLSENQLQINEIVVKPWFYGSILLGSLFILIFNVTAIIAQRGGLSVASVASKMSVVIPIFFGIIVYKESLSLFKLFGIVLALLAVYFTSFKKGTSVISSGLMMLVFILFIGSGVIDTLIKFIEFKYVVKSEVEFFLAFTFLIAGIFGLIILLFQWINKRSIFSFRSILGGIILGICNYFSLYFLVKTLQQPSIESSTVFTINNVLVVLLTSLIGIILFKEYLSLRNKVGILLSVMAIIMFYL